MKCKLLLVAGLLISCASASAAEKVGEFTKVFDAPVEKVYAAVVRVAAQYYNLDHAIKEANTVRFFAPETKFMAANSSWVYTAVCDDDGNGKTRVTLKATQALGNTQLFFVGHEKRKLTDRFWAALERELGKMPDSASETRNPLSGKASPDARASEPATKAGSAPQVQEQPAQSSKPDLATVTVKSAPDGADITVDGKYSGSTPSTVRLSPGDHTLSVEKSGFRTWQRTIAVTPGGTVTVNATLEAVSIQLK